MDLLGRYLTLQLKSEGGAQAERPFPWGTTALFLLRPLPHWTRPTCIPEGNLIYSKSTSLNINLI